MSSGPATALDIGRPLRQAVPQQSPAEDRPAVLPRREIDAAVAGERVVGSKEVERERRTPLGAEPGGMLRRSFGGRPANLGVVVDVANEGDVGRHSIDWIGPPTEPPPAPGCRGFAFATIDRP